MANVTPRQIYQALIAAGATKLQAIGILANGINESTLNPEARGDYVGGAPTSFGFVQQHGSQYAGLVTGNPSQDLGAQVRVLAQNGGFRAASGQTAGEAAGNFAANYEKCVGCQPGQAQYNARVANAAVVAGWVTSGKWPPASPAASSAAGGANGSASGGTGSDCAFGPNLPVVGKVCLVKRATIRHMVGGALMVGGFLVVLPGVVIILAYGFRASGAAAAVTQIKSVPGYGRVAAAVTPAGRTAQRTAPAARSGVTERQAQTRARRAYASGLFEGRAQAGPSEQNLEEPEYQVTEREPIGGQMGGTRTVRYRTRNRPRAQEAT